MIRKIKQSPKYDKSLKNAKKAFQNRPGYYEQAMKDFDAVTSLLKTDKPIPPRYKDHFVYMDGNIEIRELHLVSKGSNCLLMYSKYRENNEDILYIVGIFTHAKMNRVLHGSILLIDLPEETVDMILAGKLDY